MNGDKNHLSSKFCKLPLRLILPCFLEVKWSAHLSLFTYVPTQSQCLRKEGLTLTKWAL